jgi:hypothetical protein
MKLAIYAMKGAEVYVKPYHDFQVSKNIHLQRARARACVFVLLLHGVKRP